jgi:hypothetical protein
MGGRSSTNEKIDIFRADAKLILTRYSLDVMAQKMGKKDSSYLSRCIGGDRNPGQGLWDQFYAIFAQDLAELRPPDNKAGKDPSDFNADQPSSKAEQPSIMFNQPDVRDDHINTLKGHYEDLRGFLGSVIKNNEELVINNKELVNTHKDLIKIQVELFTMFKEGPIKPFSSPSEGKAHGQEDERPPESDDRLNGE